MKKKDARERVLPMIALGSDMGMVQYTYLKILAGGAGRGFARCCSGRNCGTSHL